MVSNLPKVTQPRAVGPGFEPGHKGFRTSHLAQVQDIIIILQNLLRSICLRNFFFNFEKKISESSHSSKPFTVVVRILLESVTIALEKVHLSRNSHGRAGPH